MGKGLVLLVGIIFSVMALVCWLLAVTQASTDYLWYGIGFFVVGAVIGFVGGCMPNPKKANVS